MKDRRGLAVTVGRGCELAGRGEVAALGDTAAVQRDERSDERADLVGAWLVGPGKLRDLRFEVPVPGRAERDPLPLPVDHQPDGHGLYSTGRELRHDLLPQHGRDLVAVEPVEHPAGLVSLGPALLALPRAAPPAPQPPPPPP